MIVGMNMSNRDLAIRIVDQMNEEQLIGFISMFERFYHVRKGTDEKIEKRRLLKDWKK